MYNTVQGIINIILQSSGPQAHIFTTDLWMESDFRKDANYQFLWSPALEFVSQSSEMTQTLTLNLDHFWQNFSTPRSRQLIILNEPCSEPEMW